MVVLTGRVEETVYLPTTPGERNPNPQPLGNGILDTIGGWYNDAKDKIRQLPPLPDIFAGNDPPVPQGPPIRIPDNVLNNTSDPVRPTYVVRDVPQLRGANGLPQDFPWLWLGAAALLAFALGSNEKGEGESTPAPKPPKRKKKGGK